MCEERQEDRERRRKRPEWGGEGESDHFERFLLRLCVGAKDDGKRMALHEDTGRLAKEWAIASCELRLRSRFDKD